MLVLGILVRILVPAGKVAFVTVRIRCMSWWFETSSKKDAALFAGYRYGFMHVTCIGKDLFHLVMMC